MKHVYPAVLTTEKENVLVSVPDLPGLHTFADNTADALFMAQDAIGMWLCDAENKGEPIPSASTQAEIAGLHPSAGHTVSMVAVDTDEYRRRNDTHAVKKTLSIPAWLNHRAEEANAPFSQILQQGLKEYLHIA